MGNLTRNPELRYIPSGTAVATFTIAVNRIYKLPTGERKEEVSFIRIVVWGRMAETAGEYLKKGSPVFVEGRLQSRSWDGPDGQKRSTIEVAATNVQFLRGGQSKSMDTPDMSGVQTPHAKEPLEEISLDTPPGPIDSPEQSMGMEEPPF